MSQTQDTSHRIQALALLIGLLPMGCVSAEASIPEVEVTRQNLVFEGVPANVPTQVPTDVSTQIPADAAMQLPAGIPAEILANYDLPTAGEAYHFPSLSFTYSRVSSDMPTGLSSDLHVREVTITSHEGFPSLGFVRVILLTVGKLSQPSAPPRILLQYPVPDSPETPIGRSITLPVLDSSEPVNPWEPDDSVYTLDVWADLTLLPRQAWAVDVTLSLQGSVGFKL